jgi:hypothetical protein
MLRTGGSGQAKTAVGDPRSSGCAWGAIEVVEVGTVEVDRPSCLDDEQEVVKIKATAIATTEPLRVSAICTVL